MTTPSTPTPQALAAAEDIIDHLFPGGFCGDEENSSVGHKGEAEESVAAIIDRHFTQLPRDNETLRAALGPDAAFIIGQAAKNAERHGTPEQAAQLQRIADAIAKR